jgi:hypothetical protein
MNRWYFWVLAPVMLATGLGLPFLAEPPTWQGRVVLYLVCGALVFATLGLARPRRFRWALRAVAAAILLTSVAYVANEAIAWWQGKPFGLGARGPECNLYNALCSLAAFGLPSLRFILRGRSCSMSTTNRMGRSQRDAPSNKGMKLTKPELVESASNEGHFNHPARLRNRHATRTRKRR